ncbi:hypothetical protein M432DRAFT_92239 [Thermoascus aurantiacus ATCC 26904]
MSNDGRKNFLTKVQDAKSTQQKVKESFTDTADRIARGLQPDETKGTAQSAWDKVGAFMIFSSTAVPLLPYWHRSSDKVKSAMGIGDKLVSSGLQDGI